MIAPVHAKHHRRVLARRFAGSPAHSVVSIVESPASSSQEPDLGDLRGEFVEHYLSGYPGLDGRWADSAEGIADLRVELIDKPALCRALLVPWVARQVELSEATVVEIGCGAGSKTTAFAPAVGRVWAGDLNGPHVRAAQLRMQALGISNVRLAHADARELLETVAGEEGEVDVCLMIAVLEHMTLSERLEALEKAWALLRPGGILVVVESPNRLLPWDWHSSRLPFFNMLPDELALRYAGHSPRGDYREVVQGALSRGHAEGLMELRRQGRGVSHHEFEVAIGALPDKIVADSYDAEIVQLNPVAADEVALLEFVRREGLDVAAGFTRYWIDLILRKPAGNGASPLSTPTLLELSWGYRVRLAAGLARLYDESSMLEYALPEGARELVFCAHAEGPETALRLSDGRELSAEVALTRERRTYSVSLDGLGGTLAIGVALPGGGEAIVEHIQAR